MILSASSLTLLLLLPWALLWLAGGYWLVRVSFQLPTDEEWLVGFCLGWMVENWLVNLVARVLPFVWSIWVSAAALFLLGALAVCLRFGWKRLLPGRPPLAQALVLGAITLIFFSLSRGLAIFDDFQHLATVSLIAAGDFPPHFALDPQVLFGYHHFLQLHAAQLMQVGGFSPWSAVDLSRSLALASAVMLAWAWTRRVTHSPLAGFLGGAMIAFGSGTRWLLLLLPYPLLDILGKGVQLIGSGIQSGSSLIEAMTGFWAVDGSGPISFPFAFANGVYPAGVVQAFTANSLATFMIIFLLLLTFNRWRDWPAAVLSAILISVWGLLGEAEIAGALAGWALLGVAYVIQNRSLRLPRTLWVWLAVGVGGCLIGILEGGALTDILLKALAKLTGIAPAASYQTIGFILAWPPALVSSHLGVLSLLNPSLLLIGLLELGPLLLVLPLLTVWGWKAFRLQRWLEASLAATALVTLLTVFVQFSGSTGVRNTPRLYVFMPILAAFAVPLAWIWASRRSHTIQTLAAGLGLVAMLGGVVMFSVELIATQRPVYSNFIGPLDYTVARQYWNRLEPGALVFDPMPTRAPVVFGRATNSSYTWYLTKPEWEALRRQPDPVKLLAAGFRYAYIDDSYMNEISPQAQKLLSAGCVRQIYEINGSQDSFRRLLDLSACTPGS